MTAFTDSELNLSEFVRHDWVLRAACTKADLEKSDSYVHVANKLRQGDVIEVLAKDMTFWAKVIVLSVANGIVKTKTLASVDLSSAKTAKPGYKVDFTADSWRVIRSKDGGLIKDGFPTRDDAIEFIETL